MKTVQRLNTKLQTQWTIEPSSNFFPLLQFAVSDFKLLHNTRVLIFFYSTAEPTSGTKLQQRINNSTLRRKQQNTFKEIVHHRVHDIRSLTRRPLTGSSLASFILLKRRTGSGTLSIRHPSSRRCSNTGTSSRSTTSGRWLS